jgi:hypothetical protein
MLRAEVATVLHHQSRVPLLFTVAVVVAVQPVTRVEWLALAAAAEGALAVKVLQL